MCPPVLVGKGQAGRGQGGSQGGKLLTPCCPQRQLPIQKARRQQMDMIAELKKKQMVKEPLIYEGKDGAIEDIISGERLFQVSGRACPPPCSGPSALCHGETLGDGGLQGVVTARSWRATRPHGGDQTHP